MRIFAWISLGVIVAILFGLVYYLAVGACVFKLTFCRKNYRKKVFKKDLSKKLEKFKVDLCWWDKIKFEKVTTKSFDGLKLVGHYFNANSDKTALIVHGFGSDYKEMQQFSKYFYDRNFNLLVVENRAHGESEGKCITFGWNDRKDVCSWIDYLIKKDSNQKIVLFGVSMGATTVCCCAGEKLPENVVAIISDCAFDNANREIIHVMKKHKVLVGLVKKHLYSYVKRVHGFDVMQADAIKQVKNTKVPIFYIHGKDDTYVPVENLYNLYNATPENLREKYIVEDAGHALAYSTAGILYEKKISDFLKSRTNLARL